MRIFIVLFFILSATLADEYHSVTTPNSKVIPPTNIYVIVVFNLIRIINLQIALVRFLLNQLNQLQVKFDQHEQLIKNQQTEIDQLKKKNSELAGDSQIGFSDVETITHSTVQTSAPDKRFKPSSCIGLSHLGHTLNGFYNVESETSKNIALVYCDFSKNQIETDYETRYGSVPVKSNSVHFFVTRNTSLRLDDGPNTYNVEKLNLGGGMNLANGIFTAPKPGIYVFTFKGSAIGEYRRRIPSSTGHSMIALTLNGVPVSAGYSRVSEAENAFLPISLHATLQLKKGDRIAVFPYLGDFFGSNFFSGDYTQFMGSLLEEDIAIS